VDRTKKGQRASSCQISGDRSNRYRDIVIIQFSRWQLTAILDFQKFGILTVDSVNGVNMRQGILNLMAISQTVPATWRFFDFFSICRPTTMLNLLWACLDHPRGVFVGLYHCLKPEFGCNRCSSCDNMQLLIFCILSFKTTIPVTQNGDDFFFGGGDMSPN